MTTRFRLGLCCVLLAVASIAGARLHAADGDAKAFKPFKLKTLDGTQKTLADVAGPKATLVVFFFPTCKFCGMSLPHIQQMYETYKDQGLGMVWINAVPQENKLVAGFQQQHGYTVPVLLGMSPASVDRDYKVTQTPTAFLLDPAGTVLFQQAGYPAGSEQALEQQIKKAIE